MLNQFVIKPSIIFAGLLLAVHLLAIGSVWFANLVVWARQGLVLLLWFSLFYHLYRYALLRGEQSWQSFSLDKKRVAVSLRGGDELSGDIARQTVVTSGVVVLCARLDGHRLPVCQVIFPDSLQSEAFRELRVRLKFS